MFYYLTPEIMKTMKAMILMAAMALLTACVGEPGMDGRDGLDGKDGKDGVNILGTAFEIEGDFTAANDYMLYFKFPNTIEVFQSDIVLVYILWETVTGSDNKPLDVWRLLPQTVVLNEGLLQYNYDFTQFDVQVFLGGNVDFTTLLPAEWENQVFRIVVMPADFATDLSLDLTNYNLVMKSINLQDTQVSKIRFSDIMKEGTPEPGLRKSLPAL